jgi:hypothetical protein
MHSTAAFFGGGHFEADNSVGEEDLFAGPTWGTIRSHEAKEGLFNIRIELCRQVTLSAK